MRARRGALRVLAPVGLLCAVASGASAQNLQALAARVTSKGAFDPDFNSSGFFIGTAAGDDVFNDVVIDTNQKAVVCGHLTISGAWQNITGRFNKDGTVDTSFGWFGMSWIGSPNMTTATSCTLEPVTGNIVVAIEEGVVGVTTTPSILVARLTPAGQLDPNFGPGGWTRVTIPGAAHVWPHDVRISDKKIIVGGEIDRVTGTNEAFVVRLLSDGKPDTGFGSGGIFQSNLGFGDITVRAMDVDNINRPVLVGGAAGQTLIARLRTDGKLDNGFDLDGVRQYRTNTSEAVSQGRGVIAFGSTIVLTYMTKFTKDSGVDPNRWFPAVLRLKDDGSNDIKFNAPTVPPSDNLSGSNVVGFLPGTSIPHDIARSPVTGGFVISATTMTEAFPGLTLISFGPNGALNRAFGTEGVVRPSVAATVEPFALAINSTDRTTTVGYIKP